MVIRAVVKEMKRIFHHNIVLVKTVEVKEVKVVEVIEVEGQVEEMEKYHKSHHNIVSEWMEVRTEEVTGKIHIFRRNIW